MKKLLIVIALLGLWFLLTAYAAIPAFILPKPSAVFEAYRTQLLTGALATTTRAIAGFACGIGLACLLHFGCVLLRLTKELDSQFAGARAVPMVAILPLFVIWFGFSEFGRWLLVTLSAAAFFIGPFHEGFKVLAPELVLMRKQLKLSALRYFFGIVVPAAATNLLGPLRVCFAVAFTIAIASEYVGAQIGIGKFLDSARVTFNVPAIFLCIFLASSIGIAGDWFVCRLFHRFVHWSGKDAKA